MSGKSKEEIAFEILAKLKGVGIWGENNQEAILDMYANCLEATSGMREVDGRTSIAVRIAEQTSAAKPTVAAAAPVAAAPVAAPQAVRQPQMVQPQPVQQQAAPQLAAAPAVATPAQQQQRVQQAYQQQQVQQPR